MAGIGFELKRLLGRGSYTEVTRAYLASAIISSGPWVLSILGILSVGLLSTQLSVAPEVVPRFQVTVTYLMASSLLLTSPFQLVFVRFCSDRYYEGRRSAIAENFLGVLAGTSVLVLAIGLPVVFELFEGSLVLKLLILVNLIVLSDVWIAFALASSLRQWKAIVGAFLVANLAPLATVALVPTVATEVLLFGFLVGHSVLLFVLVRSILLAFPGVTRVALEVLNPKLIFPSLGVIGVIYTLAGWVDKFIFWVNPYTSVAIMPPLRVSEFYDFPLFLAYLFTIPGMAVFTFRIETDFVERYRTYFETINEGGTMAQIIEAKNAMVASVRSGIFDIFKVQALVFLVVALQGETFLKLIGASPIFHILLTVDVLATGLNVVLLGVLNILFYFDKRREILLLASVYLSLNAVFAWGTQLLGPAFYGFGFAAAVGLTVIMGLMVLSRKLDDLEYELFMLQAV